MTGNDQSGAATDARRPSGPPGGCPELVVFDFDGTLAEQRGSWGLLYRLFGVERPGDRRTAAYWDGELTFEEWCQGNIADWRERGVTRAHLERVAAAIKLTTGAPALLDALDEAEVPFGVVSSGITDLIRRLDAYDPAFVRSNEIVYDDSGVPVDVNAAVGPDDKGRIIREICERRTLDPTAVLHVGDSHSDVEAFEVAGTAVLFDPDDRVPEAAYQTVDHVEETRDLSRLIPLVLDRDDQ